MRSACWASLAAACGDRWDPGAPPHSETFPLVCAHAEVMCETCHPADVALGPVESDCAGCHARPPSHDPATTQVCADCHADNGCSWSESVGDGAR